MTLSQLLESRFRGDIRYRGAAYLKAEQLVPGDRLVHVDGSRSVEEVAASIDQAVADLRGAPKKTR